MPTNRSTRQEPRFQIELQKLLLVEGNDDHAVFTAVCDHVGIEDVQILRYDGKNNLRNFLSVLAGLEGFSDLSAIGIVIDADEDANAEQDRIRGALRNAGLPIPAGPLEIAQSSDGMRTAFIVVPHGRKRGTIENVCLDSAVDDKALGCVDAFVACVEEQGIEIANMPKARAHAYLSTRRDPSRRVGEAALAGEWRLDAASFSPLCELVKML